MKVEKIDLYKKLKTCNQQIICINKISPSYYVGFLKFLDKYFKLNTKNITWEFPLSDYLSKKSAYVLNNQRFNWFNINTAKDLILARKLAK